MALSKTLTVTHQYQNNSNSPITVSIVCESVVSGSILQTPTQVGRPGVFTAGTPVEGSASNPNRDSNS